MELVYARGSVRGRLGCERTEFRVTIISLSQMIFLDCKQGSVGVHAACGSPVKIKGV